MTKTVSAELVVIIIIHASNILTLYQDALQMNVALLEKQIGGHVC